MNTTLGAFPVGTTPEFLAFDGTNMWVDERRQ